MKINLIRHFPTMGNKEKRYIGITDEKILTEYSKSILKDRIYPECDLVFISPLERCRQTAQMIYPNKKYEIKDGLAEKSFGIFENKTYEELKDNPLFRKWIETEGACSVPNMESKEDYTQRCISDYQNALIFAQRKGAESISFVVHGGTIMTIMDKFASPRKTYYEWHLKNGGCICGNIEANCIDKIIDYTIRYN